MRILKHFLKVEIVHHISFLYLNRFLTLFNLTNTKKLASLLLILENMSLKSSYKYVVGSDLVNSLSCLDVIGFQVTLFKIHNLFFLIFHFS